MSNLKEEELLEVLKIWYTGEHTQAYKQIWELIQKPAVTEEWIEEKAKELITMVANLYPYEANPCVIPKSKAKDFIRSLLEGMPVINKDWLPTPENINALPEPVRNYIAGLETNADPPSMIADNVILRDTVKALEKKCEERIEVTEEFVTKHTRKIAEYPSQHRVETMLKEAGVEVIKK